MVKESIFLEKYAKEKLSGWAKSCCEEKGLFTFIHTMIWVYCNILFQVLTRYFQNLPVYTQSFVTTILLRGMRRQGPM